ncbi:hypothetical protein [Novosphingobium guangzhouense]|uniref:hypothetical protein n=1 Tax=Novosphingobium guangzhouense TaxID=1850347 RepID=UPI001FEA5482|nr:hypothetical protein [Novosphingobium guangzhouense]
MQLASELPPDVEDDEVDVEDDDEELDVDVEDDDEELPESDPEDPEESSPPHAASAAAVPALAMKASARRRANISRPIA